MATSIDMSCGGYEFKFVDVELSNEYICHICTFISRDPQQVVCCGNIYCKNCLQKLKEKRNDFKCPTCRSDLTNNYFNDIRADRKIKSLQVYCTNMESSSSHDDSSCQWKGYLKDIDTHLQQCPYQFISCTNDCGEHVQQKQLQYHLENDCSNPVCGKELVCSQNTAQQMAMNSEPPLLIYIPPWMDVDELVL